MRINPTVVVVLFVLWAVFAVAIVDSAREDAAAQQPPEPNPLPAIQTVLEAPIPTLPPSDAEVAEAVRVSAALAVFDANPDLTYENIRALERIVLKSKIAVLFRRGWVENADNPGSTWLFARTFDGRDYRVSLDTAWYIQTRIDAKVIDPKTGKPKP